MLYSVQFIDKACVYTLPRLIIVKKEKPIAHLLKLEIYKLRSRFSYNENHTHYKKESRKNPKHDIFRNRKF